MVKARKYRGQGPGGSSFNALNIGYGPVQRMEERNRDLESKLERNQKIEQTQRAAFLTNLEKNQQIEADNRRQVFDFDEKQKAKVADAQFRNSTTEFENAQKEYQAIQQEGNVLQQLSQFSTTLGEAISEVKQDVQKRNYEDQYYKTYRDLTLGDVMATEAAGQTIEKTGLQFKQAAREAEASGVPFEYARQLEGLGGSRKIAAAKAVADVALKRWPQYFNNRLLNDKETPVTYYDATLGKEVTTTPHAATKPSEIMAVGQALLKEYWTQTGITEIQPALIAPYLGKMETAIFARADQAQRLEKEAYIQQTHENFLTDLDVAVNGATAIDNNFIDAQITKLIGTVDPKDGKLFTRRESHEYIVRQLASKAQYDKNAQELLFAYGEEQAPRSIAPEGVDNKTFFNFVGKAIDDVKNANYQRSQQDYRQKVQQTTQLVQQFAAEQSTNPASSEQIQDMMDNINSKGLMSPQANNILNTLQKEAVEKEYGTDYWEAKADALIAQNALTSEELEKFPFELQNNARYQNAARIADALAPEVPGTDSATTEFVKKTVAGLAGAANYNEVKDPASAYLARQYLTNEIVQLAKRVHAEKPQLTFSQALAEATSFWAKNLSKQIQDVKKKGTSDRSEYGEQPLYANNGVFENLVRDVPDYADIKAATQVLEQVQTPEDVFTKQIIPREQLESMAAGGQRTQYINLIRERIAGKGEPLSDYQIIDAQLEAYNSNLPDGEKPLPPRAKRPPSQVVVENQNLGPAAKELLYNLPTGARTTRAMMSIDINPNTTRGQVQRIANELGIDIVDLATIMNYESGGNLANGQFRNGIDRYGGGGGVHLGWIQFNPENQQRYGVYTGMTAEAHADAVIQYLKDRGVRPGDGINVIYQAIQGGSTEKARMYGVDPAYPRDANDTLVQHIKNMRAEHTEAVVNWLQGGDQNPYKDRRTQSSSSEPYDNL